MMSSKEVFQTPKAKAMYPFVTKPSTKFDPEGKYKITLVLDPKGNEEHRQFLRRLKQHLDDGATQLSKKLENMPWKKHLRAEDKSDTGLYEVTFKSSFPPRIFDAAGNKINGDLNVGNGSVVRVAYSWVPYEGFKGGVALYFQAIQIIELVEYAGGEAADYGFEQEEGWNVEARFNELSGQEGKPPEENWEPGEQSPIPEDEIPF